jgi:Asp-tRNA(Asn)/Glu-tRNA(Gln) amidotransferase C subunit
MNKIDKDTVNRIAHLARLEFPAESTDEIVGKLTSSMNSIPIR